ncbi:hypothetical protein GS8_1679 [Geobacillus stearothermophilus]|uniref:Uncharacterized protein n=1 Tax=Geobacillus stearothermophilus TaxID=1422 RepID=A0ABQ7HFM5_GEOSE|nr:hypothetical protein GS8_1679 [Geobacillus stearothermophilus]
MLFFDFLVWSVFSSCLRSAVSRYRRFARYDTNNGTFAAQWLR